MRNSFRPMVEVLEKREMLAGSLLPSLSVTNQLFKTADISPGAVQKIAAYQIKVTGHGVASLSELSLVAVGDGTLSQNLRSLDLWADLNRVAKDGPRKDGYETFLGSGSPDWETDIARISMVRKVWQTPLPLNVEVLGTFHTYLSGDTMGVYLVEAEFNGLRGDPIPQTQVSYLGVDPVLQNLRSHTFQVYQTPMANQSLIVAAGTDNVSMFQFGAYSNANTKATISFVATQGNLAYANNYRLVHTNYNGVQDVSVTGTVVKNKLAFTFTNPAHQGGTWQVVGKIKPANQLPPRASLQLAFASSPITAIDLEKNQVMTGTINNGVGAGQMQVSAYQTYATKYDISVTSPSVAVILNATSPPFQYVQPGQTVAAAKYDISAVGSSYTIRETTVSVFIGANVNHVSLWDGNVLLGVAPVNLSTWTVSFTGLNVLLGANTTKTLTVQFGVGDGVKTKATLTSLKVTDSQGIVSTLGFNVNGYDIIVYSGGIG